LNNEIPNIKGFAARWAPRRTDTFLPLARFDCLWQGFEFLVFGLSENDKPSTLSSGLERVDYFRDYSKPSALSIFSFGKEFTLLQPEERKYFEHNLLWLEHQFPEPSIQNRKLLVPTPEDFPIQYDGSEQSAIDTLAIVATQMQIDPHSIQLDVFENDPNSIDLGESKIFLEQGPESSEAMGLYYPEKENGKHLIAINKLMLGDPESIVAALAHELAHIKLLYELKLDFNDEMLTDLATVFFGFGIFSANNCFSFYKNEFAWGYRGLGYLKQEEWAYSLAVWSFLRNDKNPSWIKHLNSTLKRDFKTSMNYVFKNPDKLFLE